MLREKGKSLRNIIKSFVKGEFSLGEDFLNDCIKEFTEDHSVKLFDGYFVLKVLNIEAKLDFETCEFTEDKRLVTFKLLDLKPFYYKPFLNIIHVKFPFLKFKKISDKTNLLTCHLDEVPALKNNKIINSRYLQYLTIKDTRFTEGRVAVKLRITPKAFKDLSSKFSF